MLTPREAASGVYTHVRSLGRAGVRGIDTESVAESRLEFLDNAERIIHRALVGPPRMFAVEPDDASLNAMLTQIQARRTAVQAQQHDTP